MLQRWKNTEQQYRYVHIILMMNMFDNLKIAFAKNSTEQSLLFRENAFRY